MAVLPGVRKYIFRPMPQGLKPLNAQSISLRIQTSKGLPGIKLSQFMDSTGLLLPLLPWEFGIIAPRGVHNSS